MRKFAKIFFTLALIVIASGLIMLSLRHKEVKVIRSHGNSLFVGTKPLVDSFSKDLESLNEYWSHIHKARAYLESGDYDASKREYERAIKFSRSDGDIWMARGLRERLYEKTGEYELALQEIDWLMANNKRPDVLKDLDAKKSRLLAAKAAQKTADVK